MIPPFDHRSAPMAPSSSSSSYASAVFFDDLVLTLHDFAAVSHGSNTCLSFKSGQVIRVLNRDRSGWWDGELLPIPEPGSGTVARGWFPSNYVSSIAPLQTDGQEQPSSPRRPSLPSAGSTVSLPPDIHSPRSSSYPMPLISSSHPDATPPSTMGRKSRKSTSAYPINSLAALPTPALDPRTSLGPSSDLAVYNAALYPIIQAISCLHADVRQERLYQVQPATAFIISAVRSVLDSTDCLNRDSPVLTAHPSLSRERKQLLSVLASLVDKARNMAPPGEQPRSPESDQSEEGPHVDSILKLADKVLSHVRRFMLVAQQSGIPLPIPTPPQLPPSRAFDHAVNRKSFGAFSAATYSTAESTSPDLRSSTTTQSTHPYPSYYTTSEDSHNPNSYSLHSSISSATSYPPGPSVGITSGTYTAGQLKHLSEQSHDQVLSTVAVFIGHAHLHSRSAHPSSHAHLIDLTRDVIEKVREMLVLVESIFKRDVSDQAGQPEDNGLLVEGREALFLATTSLVTAARIATSGPVDDSMATGEEELDSLLVAATSVLRAANDCMGAISRCLSSSDADSGEYQVLVQPPAKSIDPHKRLTSESHRHQYSGIAGSPHRLSMLGRKVNALNFARTQFESDNYLRFPSPPARRSNSMADIDARLSNDLTSLSDRLLHLTERPSLLSSQKQQPTERSLTSVRDQSQSMVLAGARSSSLGHTDNPDIRSRSRSMSGSSDSRRSRDSSPPTSASTSNGEHGPYPSGERHQRKPSVGHHSQISLQASHGVKRMSMISVASVSDEFLKYKPEEVAFNAEGHVKGGTLRGLVARMTLHDTPVEASFSNAFFMTFRMFTTPIDLTNALIDRFAVTFAYAEQLLNSDEKFRVQSLKLTPIRLRVYNVFKSWLETHWRPEEDTAVLPVIMQWADNDMSRALLGPAERLMELVQKRLQEKSIGTPHLSIESRKTRKAISEGFPGQFLPPPTPILSKNLMSQLKNSIGSNLANVHLFEIDPLELARQITLIESRMYMAILPEDLIGESSSQKPGEALNIKAMSTMSTKMTGWITETILDEHDARKRTQILKFWIKLGSKLLELQNYNALMSVMSALNSSTITRLKKTWDGLGNKSKTALETINQAVSHSRNYADYREKLRKAQTPCIPFLGVYLTDMTFCQEGNPAYRPSPTSPDLQLINFDRYQKMAKIINEVQRFQVPFNFVEVVELQIYIQSALEKLVHHEGSADTLYKRSLAIEPRDNGSHRGLQDIHSSLANAGFT